MRFAIYWLHLYSETKLRILVMNEESIATRLKVFMDSMELSHSQFADSCGIPRPTLSQLLSGRNKKISNLLVGQIHRAYPALRFFGCFSVKEIWLFPVRNLRILVMIQFLIFPYLRANGRWWCRSQGKRRRNAWFFCSISCG